MRKLLSLILIAIVCTSADVTVSDVPFREEISFKGTNFILNGAGIREKYYIDLYVMGLYLKAKSNDADFIMKQNAPQLIRMVCVSNLITPEKFNEAIVEGFHKATNGKPEPFKKEIDQLKSSFSDVWKVNDEFVIYYTPIGGLEIYKNSRLKTVIECKGDFKATLMKIWLGPESVSEDLKQEILGND